jgi:hypothetical protein
MIEDAAVLAVEVATAVDVAAVITVLADAAAGIAVGAIGGRVAAGAICRLRNMHLLRIPSRASRGRTSLLPQRSFSRSSCRVNRSPFLRIASRPRTGFLRPKLLRIL